MKFENNGKGLLVPNKDLVPVAGLRVGGIFNGLIIRDGEVIDEFEAHNLVTNQGLDHILATEFTGSAQVTQWYLAPFEGNYTPVATDTATTISTNATECTAYSGGSRVAFTAVEANQQVTNSAAAASFTFNATKTIYGAFLASASAQNATTGVLFSAAQFASPKNVVSGDQLLLTYTFSAAST